MMAQATSDRLAANAQAQKEANRRSGQPNDKEGAVRSRFVNEKENAPEPEAFDYDDCHNLPCTD